MYTNGLILKRSCSFSGSDEVGKRIPERNRSAKVKKFVISQNFILNGKVNR